MKKLISILLSSIFVFSIFSTVPVSAESIGGGLSVPIVYIQGQGSLIVDGEGNEVYPVTIPENYISDAVSECMPYFLSALTKGEWDAYTEKLVAAFEPIFEKQVLDNNGNPKYGTHLLWESRYSASTVTNIINRSNGQYSTDVAVYGDKTFLLEIDWRLSPYDIIPSVKTYIEEVKRQTGYDKVNVVGRCEGANVLLAYIAEYGCDDFANVELYIPSCFGVDIISAIYSGNLYLDQDSLIRYKEENLTLGDEPLYQFLEATIDMLTETYTLEGLSLVLTPALQKLYEKVVPAVMLVSYGTYPGIWSMVNADEYETARDNIFAGKEEEYAGLIAKLDKYYENVASRAEEIITDAMAQGVNFAIITKYNEYQAVPIAASNNEVSDGLSALVKTSAGATVSNRYSTLSDYYIQKAEKNGTAKYISPDKMVDASTGLLPDTTWYVYGISHTGFPSCIHTQIMDKFFESNGTLTVFSDESIPQYLTFTAQDPDDNYGYLTPMTADTGFTVTEINVPSKQSIFEKVMNFVNTLLNFLKKLFVDWWNK